MLAASLFCYTSYFQSLSIIFQATFQGIICPAPVLGFSERMPLMSSITRLSMCFKYFCLPFWGLGEFWPGLFVCLFFFPLVSKRGWNIEGKYSQLWEIRAWVTKRDSNFYHRKEKQNSGSFVRGAAAARQSTQTSSRGNGARAQPLLRHLWTNGKIWAIEHQD